MLAGSALPARAAKSNQNLPQYPPPVDTTPLQDDRKKLDAARLALSHAQAKLNAVVEKLKVGFEAGSDRKATVTALNVAQSQFGEVRSNLLETLHADATYKSAVALRDQAAAELAAAAATDGADRATLAQNKLEASKNVTKLETDAITNDPTASAAQLKYLELGKKAAGQYDEFLESIKSNPDWAAAKDELDKDKADADQASKDYNAELAREAELQKERAAQVAQIDRQRLEQSGNNSSGGRMKR
jgi:hypothetical protein